MCSSNFDWSIETMDPGRSRQKAHEETPGTNWFAGRQLAADYPCRVTFDIQRAFRTFNVSMAVWSSFFPNFRSEPTRKKIFLANVIPL